MGIKIDSINLVGVEKKLENLADDKTMLEIHDTLARFIEPWVPMNEGILEQEIMITPEFVDYIMPYAHYMYEGIVYGPNIPIYEEGEIVGYWSPPHKSPTGAMINYDKERHKLATHHWDQAAMAAKGDVFVKQVEDILKRRLREKENG